MDKYSHSKIYKIYSPSIDKIYIGSTTQSIYKRFASHRYHYILYKKGNYPYQSSFDIVKFDNCEIKLLEEFKCENRQELFKKEGEWMKKNKNLVNRVLAGYDIDNPKLIERRKYYKQYRQRNKEHLKNYRKEYCKRIKYRSEINNELNNRE